MGNKKQENYLKQLAIDVAEKWWHRPAYYFLEQVMGEIIMIIILIVLKVLIYKSDILPRTAQVIGEIIANVTR